MRVCVVTHYMPPHTGGVERVASRLAHAYSREGWDVRWVATAAGATAGRDRANDVTLIRVPASNTLERTRSIPYPILGPSALRTVARAADDADVVHVHDCLYMTSVAAAIAARRAGAPLVVTQHVAHVPFGGIADVAQHVAYRSLGRAVLTAAHHVVFVSSAVADWFARAGIRPRSALTIANGVDTDHFRPHDGAARAAARAALGLPAEGLLAIFVGRLVPKKRIKMLVAAARQAEIRLLVVGDGPERTALAPDVLHIPHIAPDRVQLVHASADVFVLPSRSEGLPVALLEALASGLPCVVSDDPAFAAVVAAGAAHGVASQEELARALSALARDQPARAALGARARTWAVTHADARTVERRYVELIASVARR